jgi:hypothetical protein
VNVVDVVGGRFESFDQAPEFAVTVWAVPPVWRHVTVSPGFPVSPEGSNWFWAVAFTVASARATPAGSTASPAAVGSRASAIRRERATKPV